MSTLVTSADLKPGRRWSTTVGAPEFLSTTCENQAYKPAPVYVPTLVGRNHDLAGQNVVVLVEFTNPALSHGHVHIHIVSFTSIT